MLILDLILILIILFLLMKLREKKSKGESNSNVVHASNKDSIEEEPKISQHSNDSRLSNLENAQHIPFKHKPRTEEEMLKRSKQFYQLMNERRSLRFFSDRPVPIEVIENIVHTAGTSPSGFFFFTFKKKIIKKIIKKKF